MKTKIIPAIIPENFEHLRSTLLSLKGKADRVQIDVLDGVYTASSSWPYNFQNDLDFQKIINQDEGMPFWENFSFDIDLMISNPEKEYKNWIDAGASNLIFHLESLSEDKLKFIQSVKEENMIGVGVAIKTTTPNEELNPFLYIVDFVQFMGIEKIGFQGQEFDERVLNKIKDLREKRPEMDIAVDGSVNFETIKKLKDAGANILVSGSAILKAEDIVEAIEDLENI